MKVIGVRELRQRASAYLRQVEAGRAFEITARGRPVAWLVPVRHTGRRQRLVARGQLAPGTGDLFDLGLPLRPVAGIPLPSDLLRRARASER
jgi:prevent-host-death family protein